MNSTDKLVKKAVRGDDQAFLQLLHINKIDLYKTALSFLRNEEDALEAVQEVTYRAYKSIRSLKEPAYFKTWLIRIMINYCNDQLKKNKRVVLNDEFLKQQGMKENYGFLELADALNSLDDRSREILSLKYFQDMKIKEIAETLQCPEGTVKTWLNKALKALRDKLEPKGDDLHV
ncbi:sigma-70 family RNA polymerase sigma factor [Bacillus sp. FJAT-29814]|uniref:sigma-70 family RNA polymerase sigma factor n=1 Tax=Bacillus sp. FJAT-29814 TaxID=1729688 RepID=UPI00082A20D7|nr:sigma-70 family RNA polymerase sigma factor [Bacillus sp. FJAT-29814]